jgi:adenosylcobinamide-GDP ribazoletransferase
VTSDRSPVRAALSRWFLQVRLAVSFLTVLPIRIEGADESDVAASMGRFPLVGFLMGFGFAIEDRLLASLFGTAIRSALVVLSIVLLTGAIHLDGFADTADALGVGRNRARALEVLRDSRLGTFGTVAVFFALALKVLALASLQGNARFITLLLALTLARWALVAVSYKIDYLRSAGAGTSMLGRGDNQNLILASIFAILPLIPAHSSKALLACALTVIVTIAMRWFYLRWLGGVTGDLIGACGEIVEVLVMLTMAAR